MIARSIYICLVFCAVACQKKLPHLEGVDKAAWQRDKNACMGLRSTMHNAITHQKQKLRTLTETQVLRLLGRPDKGELHKRNKKLYIYYLEPGVPCKEHTNQYQTLVIRFNAVGIAHDVFIQKNTVN